MNLINDKGTCGICREENGKAMLFCSVCFTGACPSCLTEWRRNQSNKECFVCHRSDSLFLPVIEDIQSKYAETLKSLLFLTKELRAVKRKIKRLKADADLATSLVYSEANKEVVFPVFKSAGVSAYFKASAKGHYIYISPISTSPTPKRNYSIKGLLAYDDQPLQLYTATFGPNRFVETIKCSRTVKRIKISGTFY